MWFLKTGISGFHPHKNTQKHFIYYHSFPIFSCSVPKQITHLPPFFPYSKISHSFTIFFPHSKLNHSFMIFSLPIPEQDSLSLPPVHYTTHLILFYFILSSFYSQTSPVSACLSQNPQPTRHGTDTAHQSTVFPSLESSPREDTSPMHSAVEYKEYNTEPSTEKLKRRLRSSWDSEVSTSNFCLTTSTNNYLLEIQLHDGLLEVPHSTMDQFSAPAAGPRWEIISF